MKLKAFRISDPLKRPKWRLRWVKIAPRSPSEILAVSPHGLGMVLAIQRLF